MSSNMVNEQQQFTLDGELCVVDRSYRELNLLTPKEFPNIAALACKNRNMERSLQLANTEAYEKMKELHLEFNSLINGAAQMYYNAAAYAGMVHSELSQSTKRNLQGKEAERILNHIIYQTDLLIEDHDNFIKLFTGFKTGIVDMQTHLRTCKNGLDKDLMAIDAGDNKLMMILKGIALPLIAAAFGGAVSLSKKSPLVTGVSIAAAVIGSVLSGGIFEGANAGKAKHLREFITLIDQYDLDLDEIKAPTAKNLAILMKYKAKLMSNKQSMDFNRQQPLVDLSEVNIGYTLEMWEKLAEDFSVTHLNISNCKIEQF